MGSAPGSLYGLMVGGERFQRETQVRSHRTPAATQQTALMSTTPGPAESPPFLDSNPFLDFRPLPKLSHFLPSFVQQTVVAAAKSLQLCLTLCDPIDISPPGSLVPGILQARALECTAISSPMHESEK